MRDENVDMKAEAVSEGLPRSSFVLLRVSNYQSIPSSVCPFVMSDGCIVARWTYPHVGAQFSFATEAEQIACDSLHVLEAQNFDQVLARPLLQGLLRLLSHRT